MTYANLYSHDHMSVIFLISRQYLKFIHGLILNLSQMSSGDMTILTQLGTSIFDPRYIDLINTVLLHTH